MVLNFFICIININNKLGSNIFFPSHLCYTTPQGPRHDHLVSNLVVISPFIHSSNFFPRSLTKMATLLDISVSALINIVTAFAFLVAFALLRIQPINDRVYFPKWYFKAQRKDPVSTNFVAKFVNLNFKTYLTFLNWMPQALQMSESQLIQHAGLDSVAFLRIYLLGYFFQLLFSFFFSFFCVC